MTITPFPLSESDLLSYVDDRLNPARRAEIEQHLDLFPEVRARLTADLAIQQGLQKLFGRSRRGTARPGIPWHAPIPLILALLTSLRL